MAINFPNTPSNGDTHTVSGRTFTYNSSKTKWVYSNSPNASVTSSDNAPSSPNVGDMWFDSSTGELLIYYADGSSNQWVGVSGTTGATGAAGAAGSSVTSYSNLAGFPSSGNTHGDMGYAQDTKVVYMWVDSSWQRMSIGPQIGPILTTTPPSTATLNGDGSTSTITVGAVDESGFPITYDWDAYDGSTVYTASSLPNALTNVSESNGVFTLTPSTNTSHATTSLKFRTKASDGVLFTPAITTLTLAFVLSNAAGKFSFENNLNNGGVTSGMTVSVTNNMAYVTGKIGSYAYSNGTNKTGAFRITGGNSSVTSTWSVGFWVSLNSSSASWGSGNRYLFDARYNGTGGQAFIIYNSTADKVKTSYQNSEIDITGTAMTSGTFYHIVLTSGTGGTKTYFNGSLVSTQSGTTDLGQALNFGSVGYDNGSSQNSNNGACTFDNVFIDYSEIDASGVTAIYNSTTSW